VKLTEKLEIQDGLDTEDAYVRAQFESYADVVSLKLDDGGGEQVILNLTREQYQVLVAFLATFADTIETNLRPAPGRAITPGGAG